MSEDKQSIKEEKIEEVKENLKIDVCVYKLTLKIKRNKM